MTIFFWAAEPGFPFYPPCTGCIFVKVVRGLRASASAHQQKYQPLLRRGTTPIPAATSQVQTISFKHVIIR